ncbi:hypothetical protein ON010_g16245 [Phytophthora cinnamomi]|nr:hypothetical protein ON010_g16245 [Phytophthora cinnamomi]
MLAALQAAAFILKLAALVGRRVRAQGSCTASGGAAHGKRGDGGGGGAECVRGALRRAGGAVCGAPCLCVVRGLRSERAVEQ